MARGCESSGTQVSAVFCCFCRVKRFLVWVGGGAFCLGIDEGPLYHGWIGLEVSLQVLKSVLVTVK